MSVWLGRSGWMPLSPLAHVSQSLTIHPHMHAQQMLFEHWQHPTPAHAAAGANPSSAPKHPTTMADSPRKKTAMGAAAAGRGKKAGNVGGQQAPRRPRSKSEPFRV